MKLVDINCPLKVGKKYSVWCAVDIDGKGTKSFTCNSEIPDTITPSNRETHIIRNIFHQGFN